MRETLLEWGRAVKLARRLAAVVTLGVLLAAPTARAAAPASDDATAALAYEPGGGLRVGETGVTLGGYTNVNVSRDEGGSARLGLDDLSLFVTWRPTPRFHLFTELEFEDLLQVDDEGHGGTNEWRFTAERLYADGTLNDALNLRVGKFLTPVGRWNVIHAQPLVWTASRPVVTELPFDPHTTGAMVFGSLYPGRGTVAYSVFGQATNQLEPVPVAQPQRYAGGARLEYDAPHGWSVGTTFLASANHGPWRQLGGVDALFRRDRLEVMAEAVVQGVAASDRVTWGLYLQPVVRLWGNLYLVTRYEHWSPLDARTADLFVGGLAYKPWPWLVLKTEYLAATHRVDESPPGYRASVALLF